MDKKKGILFWLTGLSGSGKTTLAKSIHKNLIKLYGPTLLISGDDLRRIFNFKGYSLKEREILSEKYCKLARFITNQNINLIFATVAMMDEPRMWNKKNIKNYVEIFIKSNVNTIIKSKKKKIYKNKIKKNLVGINIKPEYPKNPDIIIVNNFDKSIKDLSKQLLNKIKKLIK